jgi:tetratricopeptide (TPR) repeat protein
MGDGKLALADLKYAKTLAPKSAVVAYQLGEIRRELGDLDGAMSQFELAIKQDSKIAQGYLGRGLIHLQRREMEDAIADISKAITLDARLPHAFANRGIAYSMIGSNELAEKDFAAAAALDPTIRKEIDELLSTLKGMDRR